MSDIKEEPVGKIVVDIYVRHEPVVTITGNVDHGNLPAISFMIKQEFLGNYLLRRRSEELLNVDAKKKQLQEEKERLAKAKLEREEQVKKEEKEKRLETEKVEKERHEKVVKENTKLEAERILRKEALRTAQQSGNQEEIAWAKKQLENTDQLEEVSKEVNTNDTGFKF